MSEQWRLDDANDHETIAGQHFYDPSRYNHITAECACGWKGEPQQITWIGEATATLQFAAHKIEVLEARERQLIGWNTAAMASERPPDGLCSP